MPMADRIERSVAGRKSLASAPAIAEFAVEGPVTYRQAKPEAHAQESSRSPVSRRYLAKTLVPAVDGQVAAQVQADWSWRCRRPRLKLVVDSATLDAAERARGQRQDQTKTPSR